MSTSATIGFIRAIKPANYGDSQMSEYEDYKRCLRALAVELPESVYNDAICKITTYVKKLEDSCKQAAIEAWHMCGDDPELEENFVFEYDLALKERSK